MAVGKDDRVARYHGTTSMARSGVRVGARVGGASRTTPMKLYDAVSAW